MFFLLTASSPRVGWGNPVREVATCRKKPEERRTFSRAGDPLQTFWAARDDRNVEHGEVLSVVISFGA